MCGYGCGGSYQWKKCDHIELLVADSVGGELLPHILQYICSVRMTLYIVG